MSLLQKSTQLLRKVFFNKYLVVLIGFVIFLTFFDNHNLISRWKTGRNNADMKKQIEFYQSEIEKNKKKMNDMQSSDESLEKYAREHYYLKKDSEDIFIIKEQE